MQPDRTRRIPTGFGLHIAQCTVHFPAFLSVANCQDLYFCVPIFLLFCKIISDHDLQSLSSLISVDFRIICYSNRTAVFHFIYKFIRFSEIAPLLSHSPCCLTAEVSPHFYFYQEHGCLKHEVLSVQRSAWYFLFQKVPAAISLPQVPY